MKLQVFFNQPFFYLDNLKSRWIYVIGSSVFALLFLFLFQPYGISEEITSPINSSHSIALFFVTISFSTFLGLSFSQFILRPLFKFNKVSNGRYVFFLFLEAFLITFLYFIFSFFIPDLGNDFENELHLSFQIKNYFRALIVLLFPFFGTIIYVLIKDLNREIQVLENEIRKFQNLYKSTNLHGEEQLFIHDENNNLELEISLTDFLFAESSNQYVLIYYFNEGNVKKHLVRTRLKAFLKTVKQFPIEQSHRSFVVNLLHVKTLIKRERKTFLIMEKLKEKDIPVSKSYLESIKNRILSP
ncbi:LytTR family transcriptional regulator [Flavobacteriaceae bacterium XHP0103]|uniref:LytTR family DNA-binding domain-containing protein n=1 Tax=Marixanthotalea marina TaxID=2844359 RepID=UPI002989C424|nr:LytTR family DNA-binding domain-containing protein [Marixanthotalea marina]MBU3820631.1 LytTR family transcriptional regulator [Marixanthotalea marina]